MNNKQEFLLEEYKQVRSELMENQRSIIHLATVAIIASTSLASALIAISLSKELTCATNDFLFPFPFLFLTPLCISIPLFYVLMSHRKDLFRAGAYIQVFYEEKGAGIAWQRRIGNFRKKMPGNPLDNFQIIFWVIFLLCTMICVLYCLNSQKQFLWYHWAGIIFIIIMAFIFQVVACVKYQAASKSYRDNCIQTWRIVRESEGSSYDISDSINGRFLRIIHCIFNLLK